MRTTPIEMERTANIPPLSKRRECKAMVQAAKYESSEDHQWGRIHVGRIIIIIIITVFVWR